MSTTEQISRTDQKQNIHRRAQWITKYIQRQQKQLSAKNLETFFAYNNDMIVCGVSENTRYKNLNHFVLLTKILQNNWTDVTEKDLRALIANIMLMDMKKLIQVPLSGSSVMEKSDSIMKLLMALCMI